MKMKPFTVRLPEELLNLLEQRCATNQRKRNDEIIFILRQVLSSSEDSR